MKQRILTAIVGLTVLVVVLLFYQTWILNIAIALVSAIGVYEIIKVTGHRSNKGMLVLSILFALAAPFMKLPGLLDVRTMAVLIYALLLFTNLLATHNYLNVSGMAICAVCTLSISFSLCSLIYLRDDFENGLYYILMIFALAWICDGGAYFVGRAIGKHKMSPQISPNKTVEGMIGGIVTNVVFAVLITWIYATVCHLVISVEQYLYVILLGILCSFIAILGDLSASIIKRQYRVKDFGNLMPGHGGVVDRFDSIFFVAPVLYLFSCWFPIFS